MWSGFLVWVCGGLSNSFFGGVLLLLLMFVGFCLVGFLNFFVVVSDYPTLLQLICRKFN